MNFVLFLIHFITTSYSQKEMNMFFAYFVKRRPNHFKRNLKDLSPNFFLLYLFNIFLDKITLKEMIMWSAFSLICLVYFFHQVFVQNVYATHRLCQLSRDFRAVEPFRGRGQSQCPRYRTKILKRSPQGLLF